MPSSDEDRINFEETGFGRDPFDSSLSGDTHLVHIPLINTTDQFELLDEQLGEGGMGTVTKAKHRRLNKYVAIKRIKAEFSNDPVALRRFAQEANAIESLDHPNIVRILDWGRDAHGPLLVLEFVDGENLKDRLDRIGALGQDVAIRIACEICEGLQHAHDLGIIHRDIKPSNILLSNNGIAKLSDFGLVRQLRPDKNGDKSVSMAGSQIGTELFMAPEQLDDPKKADVHSDLWSLGATVFQVITGRQPPLSKQHFDFTNVPEKLQRVLKKILHGIPTERYASARDFERALRALSESDHKTPHVAGIYEVPKEGQCPNCDAINPLDRKFCKGCGGSLIERCLNCSSNLAIWEPNCPECGDGLKRRQKEMLKQISKAHDEAEHLLRDQDFSALFKLLRQTEQEFTHPRLSSGMAQIAVVRRSMEDAIRDVQQQAIQLAAVEFKFDIAEDLLRRLPEALRDRALFTEVTQKRERVVALERRFLAAVDAENFHDADAIGQEIRQLQPHRQDVEDQLNKVAIAWHRLAEEKATSRQDFSAAVRLLEALPERLRNSSVYDGYRVRRDQIYEIERRIRDAIDEHNLNGLNAGLEELVQLQPFHPNRERWASDLATAVEAVHLQARGYAATTCDYMAAIEILGVVPKSLIQKSLLQELGEKRDQVSKLESAMHLAIDREDINGAVVGLDELQKLKPHKCDAIDRLRARVNDIAAEAKSIAEKHRDYDAAAKRLEILPEKVRDARLYSDIVRKRSRVVDLRSLIANAIVGERLRQADDFVSELHQLSSIPAEIETRLTRLADIVQERARVFIEDRQHYGPGEELLGQVPDRLRNSRYEALSQRRREIEAIVTSITRAIQEEKLHALDQSLQELRQLQPKHTEIDRFTGELHRITWTMQKQAKILGGKLFEYARAVTCMEQIPDSVRNNGLYHELVRLRDLVSSLERKIRRCEESRDWAGLKEYSERLLKLQPMRPLAEDHRKLATKKLAEQKMKASAAKPNHDAKNATGKKRGNPHPGNTGKPNKKPPSSAPDNNLELEYPNNGTVFGDSIYEDNDT